MSEIVKITSVTANTPVAIYYCDAMSASCVFVVSASTFPYEFEVPSPISDNDFIIKIEDTEGCLDGELILVSPTPTNTLTPTTTPTPTITSTVTVSPTITSTYSPTPSITNTITPTLTSTPSPTPAVASHYVGQLPNENPTIVCGYLMTILEYYTYLSEANLSPVLGVTIYTFTYNGVLYSPLVGNNLYFKMQFGSSFYAVQVDSDGVIINFDLCS